MEQIKIVPKDLLCIIPKFEGEEATLKFFLRKCQYIYDAFADETNPAQQTYLFHALSSRLVGRAATLLGVKEDIDSWDGLKKTLIQHFGEVRSEETIALELEQMKIRPGESYTDFYRRIQITLSMLLAKVNQIFDEGERTVKTTMYNNVAYHTFLYNLSDDLSQVVRIKRCRDLDTALAAVNEEVNFKNQYYARRTGFTPPQTVGWSATPYIHSTGFKPQQTQPKVGLFGNQNAGFGQSSTGFGGQPAFFGSAPQAFGHKAPVNPRPGIQTFGQAQTVSFGSKQGPKENPEGTPSITAPKTE